MVLLALALLGALVAAGVLGPVATDLLDTTLDGVLGLAARIVGALVPPDLLDGRLLEVALAVVPAVALLGMALLVRASVVVRRVVSVAALLATIASYAWLGGWQATLSVAVIGLVAAAVSFGTRLVVASPLAVLSGALLVRTALAILDRVPAVGRQALTAVTTLDGGPLVTVAEWLLLLAGTALAVKQWRRTL